MTYKIKSNQTIIVDFTVEILAAEFIKFCEEIDDLSNVTVYSIGYYSDKFDELISSKNKGCIYIFKPFFLTDLTDYIPISNNDIIPAKQFLFMVGKSKEERVALLGLLSYYNLLNDGHVSRFTKNIDKLYHLISHYHF